MSLTYKSVKLRLCGGGMTGSVFINPAHVCWILSESADSCTLGTIDKNFYRVSGSAHTVNKLLMDEPDD